GMRPKTKKPGTYEKRSTSQPVASAKSTPPTPDPTLANPHAEATKSLGRTSAGTASIFAVTPVYPSMAIETSAMDSRTSFANTAGIAALINNANRVTESLRAKGTATCHLSKSVAHQPPNTFPTAAPRKGIHAHFPIAVKSK